jgi:hypothetical protein
MSFEFSVICSLFAACQRTREHVAGINLTCTGCGNDCGGGGDCVGEVCRCRDGFYGAFCQFVDPTYTDSSVPGPAESPAAAPGSFLPADSPAAAPGSYDGHQSPPSLADTCPSANDLPCSGNGWCWHPDKFYYLCMCDLPWQGSACDEIPSMCPIQWDSGMCDCCPSGVITPGGECCAASNGIMPIVDNNGDCCSNATLLDGAS